jgi:hypothetical protein
LTVAGIDFVVSPQPRSRCILGRMQDRPHRVETGNAADPVAAPSGATNLLIPMTARSVTFTAATQSPVHAERRE